MKILILSSLIIGLSGCASAVKTYAPDGRDSFSLDCSGTARNWGMCEVKAGEMCGNKGYDIISKNGENVGNITVANGSYKKIAGTTIRDYNYYSNQTEVAQSDFFSTPIVNRVMLISCKQ